MKKRELILAASVVAALAWIQTPAMAQTADISGVGSGNTSANSGDVSGSTATASTGGGSALGGSGPTTGNVTLGNGTAPATGDVIIGSGTTSGNPSGTGVIQLGSNPANGGTTGTVIINPDDGSVIGIDTNGDGIADDTADAHQIQTALANLDENDAAELKKKCLDVLANPSGFDAATVGLCNVLASI